MININISREKNKVSPQQLTFWDVCIGAGVQLLLAIADMPLSAINPHVDYMSTDTREDEGPSRAARDIPMVSRPESWRHCVPLLHRWALV